MSKGLTVRFEIQLRRNVCDGPGGSPVELDQGEGGWIKYLARREAGLLYGHLAG
jgi:hypothetical protein